MHEIPGPRPRLGNDLLDRREGATGEARWRIPPGYGELSGHCYFGYAHGAAGIADVLLDLFEVTGEQQFANAASDATRWIVRNRVPVMNDQAGLAWPVVEGGKPHPPFWCHGATGVGRLLLHATRLGVFDGVNMLVQVAHAVADGATWSGPTLCHGLAGNADLLIDLARSTGDSRLLDAADRLLTIADAFRVETEKAVPGLQKHHDRSLQTTSLATAGWRLPICVERGAIGQRNCVERASVTKPSAPGMRPRTPDSRKRSEPHAVSPQLWTSAKVASPPPSSRNSRRKSARRSQRRSSFHSGECQARRKASSSRWNIRRQVPDARETMLTPLSGYRQVLAILIIPTRYEGLELR